MHHLKMQSAADTRSPIEETVVVSEACVLQRSDHFPRIHQLILALGGDPDSCLEVNQTRL